MLTSLIDLPRCSDIGTDMHIYITTAAPPAKGVALIRLSDFLLAGNDLFDKSGHVTVIIQLA